MAGTDDLDDDYVARLLAEDAKKTSQKYSSQGLSAFLPKRRAVDAPKPNTRFLSHIVREADSHNAALKRKEEIEAKKRLRELHGEEDRPRKRPRGDETADSKRSRLLKDIVSAANSDNKGRHRHNKDCSHHGTARQLSDNDNHSDSKRQKHSERKREQDLRSTRLSGSGRSASPDADRKEHSRTPRTSSRRKSKDRYNEGEASLVRRSSPASFDGADERSHRDLDQHVRKRGRGALKKTSGIDGRFEKGYDPAQDISLDSDDEDAQDWDMALEAMRDWAKWKRNQAARMREAGFDEKDIQKWEKGSLGQTDREPDLKNVRWSRKGETREWDAGKVQQ